MRTPKIIGTLTTCDSAEHRYLRGYKVKIIAIMRPGATEDDDGLYLTDDADIARAGGVSAGDRVEVAPILEKGRPSFVTSDPKAVDLGCFASLTRGA